LQTFFNASYFALSSAPFLLVGLSFRRGYKWPSITIAFVLLVVHYGTRVPPTGLPHGTLVAVIGLLLFSLVAFKEPSNRFIGISLLGLSFVTLAYSACWLTKSSGSILSDFQRADTWALYTVFQPSFVSSAFKSSLLAVSATALCAYLNAFLPKKGTIILFLLFAAVFPILGYSGNVVLMTLFYALGVILILRCWKLISTPTERRAYAFGMIISGLINSSHPATWIAYVMGGTIGALVKTEPKIDPKWSLVKFGVVTFSFWVLMALQAQVKSIGAFSNSSEHLDLFIFELAMTILYSFWFASYFRPHTGATTYDTRELNGIVDHSGAGPTAQGKAP
jgi:hypothetical protein